MNVKSNTPFQIKLGKEKRSDDNNNEKDNDGDYEQMEDFFFFLGVFTFIDSCQINLRNGMKVV